MGSHLQMVIVHLSRALAIMEAGQSAICGLKAKFPLEVGTGQALQNSPKAGVALVWVAEVGQHCWP